MSDTSTITELLRAWSDGESTAINEIYPLVEKELRRMASRHMRGESPNHTLQTTALMNEAYIKLVRQGKADWNDRTHFYAVASRVMRQSIAVSNWSA